MNTKFNITLFFLLIGMLTNATAQEFIDELNGTTQGNSKGIIYAKTPNGQGAVFSRATESCIEYPFSMGIPHQGTIEMLIKVSKGYSYNNYILLDNQPNAIIFTTGQSDVYYLGAMWLNVSNSGAISLTTAVNAKPTVKTLTANVTKFRFNEWHVVSFSFGSQGQYLKVDGQLVASNSSYTESLQACGDHGGKRVNPTIGEFLSVFWSNNRYESGFEGILDRFRVSNKQQDWKLVSIPSIEWLNPIASFLETSDLRYSINANIKSELQLKSVKVMSGYSTLFIETNLNLSNGHCNFEKNITLKPGKNEISLVVENEYGSITSEKRTIKYNEPQVPPMLYLSNINFVDKNGNNRIDGNEDCSISFTIANKGKGSARNLKVVVQNSSNIQGLNFSNSTTIGIINPNANQTVNVPIIGTMNLSSGTASIKISFEEQMGFPPDPFELNIETKEFIKPNVQVVDNSFLTDNGVIKLGFPVQLKVLIQNIGQGVAENVTVGFQYPSSNVFPNGPKDFEIGTLQAGATKELIFEFIANKLYTEKTIPITTKITEKFGKFSENKQVIASIDAKSSGTAINIASNASDTKVEIQVASLTAEVDKNIPLNSIKYPDRYALIIGNEDYSSRQKGLSSEVDVAFAVNDAKIFKEYCVKTLGVEEKNIFLLTNATSGEMQQKIELISQILTRIGNKGELIFFYAGHGFPDENTKEPYLIPVDVTATNLASAVKLYDVYKRFSQTGAKRVTVLLDACFTGGGRESGLLAARGVKVRPREEIVSGNMVIFAATSEDQSALPYKDKQHGMFTYFLLKKLQETKGDVTYSALEEYIRNNVSIESLKINSKAQDPKANVSPQAKTEWETWKLK